MEFDFLKERLERFLAVIPEAFKIAEPIQKGPKGLSVSLERDTSKKNPQPKKPEQKQPAAEVAEKAL